MLLCSGGERLDSELCAHLLKKTQVGILILLLKDMLDLSMNHVNTHIARSDAWWPRLTIADMLRWAAVLLLSRLSDSTGEKAPEELVLRDCNPPKKERVTFISDNILALSDKGRQWEGRRVGIKKRCNPGPPYIRESCL